MKYNVVYTPDALRQLDQLQRQISAAASPLIAQRYVAAIMRQCASLATFPLRGTKRDDVRPGLRVFGFRRRVLIGFRVANDRVVILGVLYGGQDFESLLRDEN